MEIRHKTTNVILLTVEGNYRRETNLRGADLREADLRRADLGWADLGWADLRRADLHGTDLREADLRGADLRGADLRGADLCGANMGNIPIVPNIDATMLAAIEANKITGKNGLKMSQWHGSKCNETNWCETTHCRAGYAICLAGKAGFELERRVGPETAGALIYAVSSPENPIPNFYATDEEAMADITARASKLSRATT